MASASPIRRVRASVLAAALLGLGLMLGAARPASAQLGGLPPGFIDEPYVGGLPFPTAVAFLPNGRMLVALKAGQVLVYQGTTLLGTFIDIHDQVHDNHDRGLLSIAVHPNFPTTPYVYLLYTYDPPGVYPDNIDPSYQGTTSTPARVARLLRVEADSATDYTTAKTGTQVVLLGTNSTRANIGSENDGRNLSFASCMSPKTWNGTPVEDCIASDEDSHTIGTVVFGSDGSLFVSSGDGSNYGGVDPRALRSQSLDSLNGKVLRIDPITGLGLPDNPFYVAGSPGRNRSKIWAYGLRNPFRIAPKPNKVAVSIGDVGWNTWEEIDDGKGANFGWPCYEGGAVDAQASGITTSLLQAAYRSNTTTKPICQALYDQGLGAVKAPTFAYDHTLSLGSSADAGAYYNGSTYPPAYQGALFIADYNERWIRYLTFDAQGIATYHPFGLADTGPVQVVIGPDSNLYWMRYKSSGGELRRVRYLGSGNTPPVVVINADPTIGVAPLQVSFDSTGSYDPDAQTFSYAWDFGDGTTSTEANPVHVYQTSGVYDAVLTLTEQTTPFASSSSSVRITVGTNPPLATIESPANGTMYRVGDVIAFSGRATSGTDPVPATQMTWELRTLHNQHIHYDSLLAAPDASDPFLSIGSFTVSDHGDNVRLQICLTVTLTPDPLTDTQCVDLYPEKTEISLVTVPAGLDITYEDEGMEISCPGVIDPVVNSTQTISVIPVQQHRSFVQWDDGLTSTSRTFTVGTTPETFTAIFENQAPTAVITPASATGIAPLTVQFDAAASTDPEGDTLTYAWDAGDAGTSTDAAPFFTFSNLGDHTVTLTVTDQLGATDTTQVVVSTNDGSPIPTITSPGVGTTWRADGSLAYAGQAVDPNSGPMPASQLSWQFYLHLCDAQGQNCQTQLVSSADGVSGGSLLLPTGFGAGPLHPAFLEVRLTASTLAATGWFDTAWAHRRPIAIDNTAQAEELTDFPVLVRLDSSRINYAAAGVQGQDLRFTDAAGQLLAHEIEDWNPTGESTVWVKVPTIPASSAAGLIYMYYGNPLAPDTQDHAAVWSNGYAAVWHLNGALTDSTANANDGSDENGSTTGAGRFAGARFFDGVDDAVFVPSSPSLELQGPISLEGWVQVPDTNRTGAGRILDKKIQYLTREGYDLEHDPANNRVSSVGRGSSYLRATNIDLDPSWHYLASAMYGTTGAVYVDGVDVTVDNTVNTPVPSTQPLTLGRRSGGGDYWLGGLDEIRISHVARSPAWFAAQWRSMSDTFLNFQPEQAPTVLTGTASQLVTARTVSLTFDTHPTGLALQLGGQPITAAKTVVAVVGATGTIAAPSPQMISSRVYVFTGWSDGGAASHVVTAPAGGQTYLASYQVLPGCSDGIDNDGDGFTDYPADAQCASASQQYETKKVCGLGGELALGPLLWFWRRRLRPRKA